MSEVKDEIVCKVCKQEIKQLENISSVEYENAVEKIKTGEVTPVCAVCFEMLMRAQDRN